LRHISKLKPWPLYEVLTEKYEWDPAIAQVGLTLAATPSFSPRCQSDHLINAFQSFSDFLMPMLEFDPTERVTAEEALELPFLTNI
jgi:serine/threonine protein kinase